MSEAELRARAIAKLAHRGQKYGELDYFEGHVEAVVKKVLGQLACKEKHLVAAYLHDVIEDTELSLELLRLMGVGEDALAIVDTLTRRKGETYSDYVARVALDADARLVKLADLDVNLAAAPPGSLRKRYTKAATLLTGALLADMRAGKVLGGGLALEEQSRPSAG